MSIDRYIYAGAYLEISEFKVAVPTTVRGCSVCATTKSQDTFCPQCGNAISDYQVTKQVSSIEDLISYEYKNESIDESTHDYVFEEFAFIRNEIMTLHTSKVSEVESVNYDLKIIEMPTFDLADVSEVFETLISILDRHNIQHTMKTAIMYYAR